MGKFVTGFLCGLLLAGTLAWGGTKKAPARQPTLSPWSGEGARQGLYYAPLERIGDAGTFLFFECKPLPPVKVKPPQP